MINMRCLGVFAFMLLISLGVVGQVQRYEDKMFFKKGKYNIDLQLRDNSEALKKLYRVLEEIDSDATLQLDKVEIKSFASPLSGKKYNLMLTQSRNVAVEDELEKKYPFIKPFVEKINEGIDWEGLRTLVANSKMSLKDEVLKIIDSEPEENQEENDLVDSRNKKLMEVGGGQAYKYMMIALFPELRFSHVAISYSTVDREPIEEVEESTVEVVPVKEVTPACEYCSNRCLKFALKTNLLFDLALTPNIEAEIPLGKRWSVDLEYMRGWWLHKHTFCWQVHGGNIEARYWLGNRNNHKKLQGWFVGAYVGGAFYDFQLKDDVGYRGQVFFPGGVSGGYCMELNKYFNMEFSVGFAYFTTNYKKYRVYHNIELIKDGPTKRLTGFYPTKVKISLVWKINGRKGGKR